MYPTNSIAVFLSLNDFELRCMVRCLCDDLDFPGPDEDIVQDIYYKFLTSQIIQSFCPVRGENSVKMTTYLFPIIRNFILSKLKSKEYRILRHKFPDFETTNGDIDDLDLVLHNNPVALDFQTRLINNESSTSPDGLGADLRDFERTFSNSRSDKEYSLSKRKFKNVDSAGCKLSDIFNLLYKGYSSKEIAAKLGVTSMSITNMKHQLAQIMIKYGFGSDDNDNSYMPEMPF